MTDLPLKLKGVLFPVRRTVPDPDHALDSASRDELSIGRERPRIDLEIGYLNLSLLAQPLGTKTKVAAGHSDIGRDENSQDPARFRHRGHSI